MKTSNVPIFHASQFQGACPKRNLFVWWLQLVIYILVTTWLKPKRSPSCQLVYYTVSALITWSRTINFVWCLFPSLFCLKGIWLWIWKHLWLPNSATPLRGKMHSFANESVLLSYDPSPYPLAFPNYNMLPFIEVHYDEQIKKKLLMDTSCPSKSYILVFS